MQKVVLDTDLLSDLLKQANPAVTARAHSYQQTHQAITLTSFSVLEILSGLRHIQAHAQLRGRRFFFRRMKKSFPRRRITDLHMKSSARCGDWVRPLVLLIQ